MLTHYLQSLNQEQKLSLWRLLYWKNHKEPIPQSEAIALKTDGFLTETSDGDYIQWSDEAQRIDKLFN
jgi:hypothetical protein